MGKVICIYCGRPARQRDSVPVCDPYCEESKRWPWGAAVCILVSVLAISGALVLGAPLAAFLGLAALVLAVRSLVYYALGRAVPK